MGRILTGRQIVEKEFTQVVGISQEMQDSIGDIEDSFSCCVWGHSGNGKTTFTLEMITQLQVLGKVLYLGYEEGHGKSFKKGLQGSNIDLDKLQVAEEATFDELVTILTRRKSAKIIVVDSVQYSGFTMVQYKKLKSEFMFGRAANARKIFIFISHASGSLPEGKTAIKIAYDANIKIHVNGFIAFVKSRYRSKKNYVIYEDGAKDSWGEKFKEHTAEVGKRHTKKKTIKKKKNETAVTEN